MDDDQPAIARIRRAGAADCDAAAGLLAALGYERRPGDLARALDADPDQHVLIAEVEGAIVGLVAMRIQRQFHIETPVAAIDALIVSERTRSSGVGALLLDAAVAVARAAGACHVELHSNRRRERARHFYERYGFSITSNYFRLEVS